MAETDISSTPRYAKPTVLEKEPEKPFAETQLHKQNVRRCFREGHLASLNLQKYVALWREFPCEVVTHVTGQGVQDHYGAVEQRGLGEYSTGFMDMITDGRLRPPLGVYLKDRMTKEAVAKALGIGSTFATKEKALAYLNRLTDGRQGWNSYADFMAVHFAAEEVADRIYGSERGNEIFIMFPSVLIASQYVFLGKLTEGGGGQHNDVWVWTKNGNGLNIAAGIVFIPADANVDPVTGSRYKLDEHKRAVVNQKNVALLKAFVNSKGFNSFKEASEKVYGKFPSEQSQEEIDQLKRRAREEFGITDARIVEEIILPRALIPLSGSIIDETQGHTDALGQPLTVEREIQNILRPTGVLFEEADTPITSEEFWEDYFAKQPKYKPSKIVYYTGGDPTKALIRWREENGLTQRAKETDFGFSERRIKYFGDPRTTAGKNRFRKFAEKVIDEYFRGNP